MRSLGGLSKTDLVYACLIAVLIALLALFALLGYSFAALALPLVIGGAAGYGLARLVTLATAPGWVRAVAVLSAAIALILGCLSLVLPLANPALAWSLPDLNLSGSGTVLGRSGSGSRTSARSFGDSPFPCSSRKRPKRPTDKRGRERAAY